MRELRFNVLFHGEVFKYKLLFFWIKNWTWMGVYLDDRLIKSYDGNYDDITEQDFPKWSKKWVYEHFNKDCGIQFV